MNETPIGAQCTAVPDGIIAGGKVRLSLVLTPDVRSDRTLKELKLQNWPKEIANLVEKNLVVCLNDGRPLPFTHDDAVSASQDEANTLWQKIFPKISRPDDKVYYDSFDYLYKVLSANTKGEP